MSDKGSTEAEMQADVMQWRTLYSKAVLDELAYQVEIHIATLEYYRMRRSGIPKGEVRRYEGIVQNGIIRLLDFGYTVHDCHRNSKSVGRVRARLEEVEQ